MTILTFLIVLALLTFVAFYKGREVLFTCISSFYPAIVLYKAFPYTKETILFSKTSTQVFYSHLLIFMVFFLIFYFIMKRITHARSSYGRAAGIVDAVLLALSIISLTIILTTHILPARDIYNFSNQVDNFFSSSLGYFLSLLFPLGIVAYLSKKHF